MHPSIKPQITTLEESEFPGSGKTFLIQTFAPPSQKVPQAKDSKQKLRKQIKDLRSKMYKDELIAEMNYECSLKQAKRQERARLLRRITDSIELYEIGIMVHHEQIRNAQREYQDNLENIQEELDNEFLNELIQE